MKTNRCILTVFCTGIVLVMASLSMGTQLDITASGLSLASGNYGASLILDDLVEISALSMITSGGSGTGAIYLDGDKGFGVLAPDGSGSKAISGGGKHQDEALVFNFITDVMASSIVVGLNSYKASRDDPVITLAVAGGGEVVFGKSHANWGSAVTSLGGERVSVDMGILLGPGYSGLANTVSVMETTGHLYVNSIAAQVPEPATVALLGLGGFALMGRFKRK